MKRIRNTIGILALVTVASQITGFLRESVFAYFYGTSMQADAYVMASQIPVTLFAVVSTSISTVALPVYTQKKETGGTSAANTFLKSFYIMFAAVCGAFLLFAEAFAPALVRVFAPGFPPETFSLTVAYTRALFPTIFFTGSVGIFTVIYHSEGRFLFPHALSLVQNFVMIAFMALLSSEMETGAAVAGAAVGIFLNAAFLVLPHAGIFRYKIEVPALWGEIRYVLARILPVVAGVGIAEINRMIDRAIASSFDTGSVTALNYANKLTAVFASFLLSAVSMVAFQTFSKLAAKRRERDNYNMLLRYVSALTVILLPISAGAIITQRELITLAFARGAFDSRALAQTVGAFQFYALGIPFIAAREIFSKFFYAKGDTKTPMLNSAIGVLANIILNLILSRYMGAAGLALATSLSGILICFLLGASLLKAEKAVRIGFFSMLAKTGAACAVMTAALLRFRAMVSPASPKLSLLLNFFAGVVVYFAVLFCIDRKIPQDALAIFWNRHETE